MYKNLNSLQTERLKHLDTVYRRFLFESRKEDLYKYMLVQAIHHTRIVE